MVMSLLARRDGDLWLATYGGGVSRLSGGRFTQYAMRDGLSSDFTTCLFEDRAGTLWIGTEGGGMNAFSQGRFASYTTEGEGDHKIYAINVHGNRLELDTAFDVDFDRDINTGPARPHGVAIFQAQDD